MLINVSVIMEFLMTYSMYFLPPQACIDENLEMVEMLVKRGANLDACDNEGWTCLHAAASAGNVEIAQ